MAGQGDNSASVDSACNWELDFSSKSGRNPGAVNGAQGGALQLLAERMFYRCSFQAANLQACAVSQNKRVVKTVDKLAVSTEHQWSTSKLV